GNTTLLDRGEGGVGKIFAEKIQKKGSFVKFQTPENELAVVARRDSIQHPFFEPLYQWGKSLLKYDFGGSMGHQNLAMFSEEHKKLELAIKDAEQVVAVYKKGDTTFGRKFKSAVISDMATVGYELDDIGLTPPSLIVPPGVKGE